MKKSKQTELKNAIAKDLNENIGLLIWDRIENSGPKSDSFWTIWVFIRGLWASEFISGGQKNKLVEIVNLADGEREKLPREPKDRLKMIRDILNANK